MDVSDFISLCTMALSAGTKALQKRNAKKLSSEEQELLALTDETGRFRVVSRVEGFGTWVRAGKRDFVDHNDPSSAARYLEAFGSLCERGYVAPETGSTFKLTGSGFKRVSDIRESRL